MEKQQLLTLLAVKRSNTVAVLQMEEEGGSEWDKGLSAKGAAVAGGGRFVQKWHATAAESGRQDPTPPESWEGLPEANERM